MKNENENENPAFLESSLYKFLTLALNDWMEGANLISEWSLFHESAPQKANYVLLQAVLIPGIAILNFVRSACEHETMGKNLTIECQSIKELLYHGRFFCMTTF